MKHEDLYSLTKSMGEYRFNDYAGNPVVYCDCIVHKYKIAYLCSCMEIVLLDEMDYHKSKAHEMFPFNTYYFYHKDTSLDVYKRLIFNSIITTQDLPRKIVMEYYEKLK